MKNLFFCAAFLCVGLLAVVVVNGNNRFEKVQTSTHFLVNPVFGEVTAEVQQRYDSKTSLTYDYHEEAAMVYDCGSNSYKFNP